MQEQFVTINRSTVHLHTPVGSQIANQKLQKENKYYVEMNAGTCNAFSIVGTRKHEPPTSL